MSAIRTSLSILLGAVLGFAAVHAASPLASDTVDRADQLAAQKAAQDAINGWDPSGGAIYYYNPAKTSNAWMRSRPVIVTIGSHVFCK